MCIFDYEKVSEITKNTHQKMKKGFGSHLFDCGQKSCLRFATIIFAGVLCLFLWLFRRLFIIYSVCVVSLQNSILSRKYRPQNLAHYAMPTRDCKRDFMKSLEPVVVVMLKQKEEKVLLSRKTRLPNNFFPPFE